MSQELNFVSNNQINGKHLLNLTKSGTSSNWLIFMVEYDENWIRESN